ncbi:MAG: hypothetical protein IJ300_08775 [Clostridia bacterium]|nr:hypothetical protein [Clostridia bacterium]
MYDSFAFLQEFEVFKALATKDMMRLYETATPHRSDYYNIVSAMEKLGFTAMAEQMKHIKKEDISKPDLDSIFYIHIKNKYFTESDCINLFIDNLMSEGMKNLFKKLK